MLLINYQVVFRSTRISLCSTCFITSTFPMRNDLLIKFKPNDKIVEILND